MENKIKKIFDDCSIEELAALYQETKLYNHFAEIPGNSILFPYMKKYFEVSPYMTTGMFYLYLTRAYIDKMN